MVINVTDLAREELDKILANKSQPEKKLRIYIAGFGWGGPSFGLALDEQKDNDFTSTVKDLDFVVDEDVTVQYDNLTVDFSDDWLRKGFRIYADGSSGGC